MRTSEKLWLGFGTLIVLLVLVCAAILWRLQSLDAGVEVQSIEGFTLVLLTVGVALAAVTSGVVGRGIVRNEREIEESNDRYRTLVTQVQEHAIFGIDERGRATTWNEGVRRVLGFEEKEFVGTDVTDTIFTPEDVESGVPERELSTAAMHGSASDDRWMMRKDGTRFWAAGITTARRDAKGALLGYTKVMRDMTERKRMEEALRHYAADLAEADQRKDEFLAMLAHELRNPLAPIKNSLAILRAGGVDDPAALPRATEVLSRQVGQMARFVDDLIDVSRVSRGKIELRKQAVSLTSVFSEAVEVARPLFQSRRQHLEINEAPEIVVDADPTRLSQVISNLLSNAAKFTDDGGRITLSSSIEGGSAVIRVSDNGIGIAPEQLKRIFDIFTQLDTSLERSRGGLGIGLTLARDLVELHGGTIEVASEGVGTGTTFTIRLPRVSDAAAVTGAQPVKDDGGQPARRLLVVDDNIDGAESLAMLLRLHGHEVEVAHDGLDALAAAARMKPDAVLLDIGLPKLNGYEVCRRLRDTPGGTELLMIAVTGWGQASDHRKTQEAGFDHHLVKPVDEDEVLRLLTTKAPLTGN